MSIDPKSVELNCLQKLGLIWALTIFRGSQEERDAFEDSLRMSIYNSREEKRKDPS